MQEFLNTQQIAQRYSVTRCTVYLWRRKGILPKGLKIGGVRLWAISDIEALERRLQA